MTSSSDRENVSRGILLLWRTIGKARDMEVHSGAIESVMTRPRGGIERIFNIHLSPVTARESIQKLAAEMRAGRIPDSLLVPLDPEPPDLVDLLLQEGFSLDTSSPCMVLDLENFLEVPKPAPQIHVAVVEDTGELKQWADIVNVALAGSELMSYEQFLDLYSLDNTVFFLATYDGIPACTAMFIMEDGLATLEMVSTLKAYRQRGLGSAVTFAALKTMQSCGIKTATLRAELDGINLYRKAGFRVVCPRTVAYLEMSISV